MARAGPHRSNKAGRGNRSLKTVLVALHLEILGQMVAAAGIFKGQGSGQTTH